MSSNQDETIRSLAQKLGYNHLQDWQANLTQEVLNGHDVVLTAGTGRGKSTLLLAPLLVKRGEDSKVVGLSIAPTKTLGEDQVHSSFCQLCACPFLILWRLRLTLPQ